MTKQSIPFPKGGFTTNEAEARWLADTIQVRAEEMLTSAGMSVSIKSKDDSLYTLILMSLDSASKRTVTRQRAAERTEDGR